MTEDKIFTIVTNIVVLLFITALVMSFLPDEITYNYLGEIKSHDRQYHDIDPKTQMPIHHMIRVVYVDKNGETVTAVDDITLSETMMAKTGWKRAYSVNPLVFPPYWWILFAVIGIVWLILEASWAPSYLTPSEYIDTIRCYSVTFERLEKFFGK